jgi:hypothetical protein
MFTENEESFTRVADYVNCVGFVPSSAGEMIELARERATALAPAGRGETSH